jgi:hypothetical protein
MRVVLVLLVALVIGAGCSDGGDPCGGVPSVSSGDPSPPDSVAWRVEAAELLAAAPTDSVITIVVFIHPQAKAAFREWEASSPDVSIRYEFGTISAFTVIMPVRALTEMLKLQGISAVDWSTGLYYPLC